MKKDMFNKMLSFLNNLEGGKISYSLHHYRDNAIMITVAVPGERWGMKICKGEDSEPPKSGAMFLLGSRHRRQL
jgi:hypothetical protein